MNIFRKKRPQNKERVWGFNEPIEREDSASVSAAPGPAASQVQDDFLGALASAAVSDQSSQSISVPVPSAESSAESSTESYSTAERLERISRRLDKLFERIDLVEHKVRRIEGKGPDY